VHPSGAAEAVGSRSVKEILLRARAASDLGARVELVSGILLGRPYQIDPLIGSAETPERFVASLQAFDCVTYVETVFAAAFARDEDEFVRTLERLRYEGGNFAWEKRNHYMTSWIRCNQRAGLMRSVPLGPRQIEKRRVLDVVAGLPPRVQRFRCLPKGLLRGAAPRLRTGDLICFASTRRNLDVFHCGLVVKEGTNVLLRHASRSQGGVVQQDLFDFLRRNRMAGVIVARPVERGRA
jgi:Protein of unknown function (DUF1460)